MHVIIIFFNSGWNRVLGHRVRQGGLPGCLHQGDRDERVDPESYGKLLTGNRIWNETKNQ